MQSLTNHVRFQRGVAEGAWAIGLYPTLASVALQEP